MSITLKYINFFSMYFVNKTDEVERLGNAKTSFEDTRKTTFSDSPAFPITKTLLYIF